MQRITSWSLRVVMALFVILSMPVQAGKPIRFAPLPMASLEQMTREYLPFLDYLEKQSGQTFELAYHASYEDLLTALASGQVDLAYLGPLPYVVLTEQTDSIVPIVQLLDSEGAAEYTCAIVHFADHSPNLEHTGRPHRVALTQPLSTCGYLSVEHYLNAQGQSLEDQGYAYHYVGSHENVAMGVILDEFDLGGMKTQIAQRYHHLGLRIVAETDPMPGFVLVANRMTLQPELIDFVRDALLRLEPLTREQDREAVQGWSNNLRYGARPVDEQTYEKVRERWRQLKIDWKGAEQ